MRDIIVYAVIVLLYKVESLTFCDHQKCACVNINRNIKVTCSSDPSVLEANYTLPNRVKTLDLSLNNLTQIQRSLVSDTLIELLLNNNQITTIVTDAFNLPKLKLLDLSHNDIEFIHRNTFAQITNLRYLNLANNKFGTFGNLNFHYLKFLQEIVFDNNNIGPSLEKHNLFKGGYELTNDIQSMSLRNVNLNGEIPHIFVDAKENLKKIILAQNNLTRIPELPLYLEYLDISSNPIKNISGDFFDVVYLSVLKLNNILIDEVPNFAFQYLTSLRQLELERNTRLKKISPLAWGWIILDDQTKLLVNNMTLRGSNLKSLDSRLEGIFKKIVRVDLQDNPWHCDCHLAWLQQIQIPKDLIDFRCSTPDNFLNRRVVEVKELTCDIKTPSGDLNFSVTIFVYCFLLTSSVIVMYFFIFSPKPIIYRQLPMEFPRTP